MLALNDEGITSEMAQSAHVNQEEEEDCVFGINSPEMIKMLHVSRRLLLKHQSGFVEGGNAPTSLSASLLMDWKLRLGTDGRVRLSLFHV